MSKHMTYTQHLDLVLKHVIRAQTKNTRLNTKTRLKHMIHIQYEIIVLIHNIKTQNKNPRLKLNIKAHC